MYKEQEQNNAKKNLKNTKVYLSSLPGTLSKKTLLQYFSNFGEIRRLEFLYDRSDNGQNILTNGLLTCADIKTKEVILRETHKLEGNLLNTVEYLEENDLKEYLKKAKSHRVYIKKMPDYISESELEKIFSRYGEVESAYAVDGKKKRKGLKYGYVLFKNQDFLTKIPINGVPYNGIVLKWDSYELKQVVNKSEGSRGGGELKGEKMKLLEIKKEVGSSIERNKLIKRKDGINIEKKIKNPQKEPIKRNNLKEVNEDEKSKGDWFEIYIPKKKIISSFVTSSKGKKGVGMPSRRHKFIRNFKKAHYYKPGKKEYHIEKRMEAVEFEENYVIKKEEFDDYEQRLNKYGRFLL